MSSTKPSTELPSPRSNLLRVLVYTCKGCQYRCFFCYCRERRYCPFEDLNDFGHVIEVKENAPDLLRGRWVARR